MPHRAFDHLETRCPQLGGPVTFGYCRTLQDNLPCPRALVCFDLVFPVIEYFRRVLHEETFQRCFAPEAKDRVAELFREVDAARKRQP